MVFSTLSGAATITVELAPQWGENVIDLGAPIGKVLSMRLSGSLETTWFYFDCTATDDSPGICMDYTGSYRYYAFFKINPSEALATAAVTESGDFDVTFSYDETRYEQLFADGTEVLEISYYVDPVYSQDCAYGDVCRFTATGGTAGDIILGETAFLTVEFDEAVPVDQSSWSTIKVLYR
jgi:hypothetical protein